MVGSQDCFGGNVVKGKDPLQLFPFGVENMGESGLFQSHRLNDVGDGLFPGGCTGGDYWHTHSDTCSFTKGIGLLLMSFYAL